MGETAAVAGLTLLALALPLRGSPPGRGLALLLLAATVVGVVVAMRRPAGGDALERTLRRAAVSALVASAVALLGVGLGDVAG